MNIIYYKVRCPRCRNIEKVTVGEIDWKRMNHKLCSICELPIKVTDDYGFLEPNVIPVIRCSDEV